MTFNLENSVVLRSCDDGLQAESPLNTYEVQTIFLFFLYFAPFTKRPRDRKEGDREDGDGKPMNMLFVFSLLIARQS